MTATPRGRRGLSWAARWSLAVGQHGGHSRPGSTAVARGWAARWSFAVGRRGDRSRLGSAEVTRSWAAWWSLAVGRRGGRSRLGSAVVARAGHHTLPCSGGPPVVAAIRSTDQSDSASSRLVPSARSGIPSVVPAVTRRRLPGPGSRGHPTQHRRTSEEEPRVDQHPPVAQPDHRTFAAEAGQCPARSPLGCPLAAGAAWCSLAVGQSDVHCGWTVRQSRALGQRGVRLPSGSRMFTAAGQCGSRVRWGSVVFACRRAVGC